MVSLGWLRGIASSREEREAAELRASLSDGTLPICDCAPGTLVDVAGTVRTLTQRPASARPALEIELFDGSGSVRVIWLGRHRIGGIEPGRRMRVHGRITRADGTLTIFNPRYELQAP